MWNVIYGMWLYMSPKLNYRQHELNVELKPLKRRVGSSYIVERRVNYNKDKKRVLISNEAVSENIIPKHTLGTWNVDQVMNYVTRDGGVERAVSVYGRPGIDIGTVSNSEKLNFSRVTWPACWQTYSIDCRLLHSFVHIVFNKGLARPCRLVARLPPTY